MFETPFIQNDFSFPSALVAESREPISKRAKNFIAPIISGQEDLFPYTQKENVIMVCSPGRSGSTFLIASLLSYINGSIILKSHLLPPKHTFKGKIIFIFSSPDQAAESAFYKTINDLQFGARHFDNMETADHHWLNRIGGVFRQTEKDNLLSYDALGCFEQLRIWLHTQVQPCQRHEAQILALKYEDLWESVGEIRAFLHLNRFSLPEKKSRGYSKKELTPLEVVVRQKYNLGTPSKPRYKAYDAARDLWEKAPAFQYLKILP